MVKGEGPSPLTIWKGKEQEQEDEEEWWRVEGTGAKNFKICRLQANFINDTVQRRTNLYSRH